MEKHREMNYTSLMSRITSWFTPTITIGRSLRGEVRLQDAEKSTSPLKPSEATEIEWYTLMKARSKERPKGQSKTSKD